MTGQTLDVHFRDGAELALLPRATHRSSHQPAIVLVSADGVAARYRLRGRRSCWNHLPMNSGLALMRVRAKLCRCRRLGFSVDVLRNSQVTVATMESLSNYSVVYMETHSGTLGDGDAIVLTRQTSSAGITNLFKDGSVAQGLAYGDQALYIAIKCSVHSPTHGKVSGE